MPAWPQRGPAGERRITEIFYEGLWRRGSISENTPDLAAMKKRTTYNVIDALKKMFCIKVCPRKALYKAGSYIQRNGARTPESRLRHVIRHPACNSYAGASNRAPLVVLRSSPPETVAKAEKPALCCSYLIIPYCVPADSTGTRCTRVSVPGQVPDRPLCSGGS